MNKQKLLSVLSLVGFIFIIGLVVTSYREYQGRGEILTRKVEVPVSFSRQFNRVITKRREEEMIPSPFFAPDGRTVDWKDFSASYTLVNFWATWCAPCVVELPSLGRLQKRYEGKGLDVIAVSLDGMLEHDDIRKFLARRTIGEFAAYFDGERHIQKNIKMRGIPTSYLFDSKGNISHVFEGDANWVSRGAIEFFDALLKQNN